MRPGDDIRLIRMQINYAMYLLPRTANEARQGYFRWRRGAR